MGAGTRVRDLRKIKKLTQPQLAELVGVNQSTLSDIERGSGFSAEILMKLADHLDAPADYIMRGKSAAWPFQKIELSRVMALSAEDRTYVEGGLAAALRDVEKPTVKPADAPVTHPQQYPDRRGAKETRQRGAIPPIEDGGNEGIGSNRRIARRKGR